MKNFIVTVRLPSRWNGHHDPRNKVSGACPFSPVCTDLTGEHHSFIVMAPDWVQAQERARQHMKELGFLPHVTRVEEA